MNVIVDVIKKKVLTKKISNHKKKKLNIKKLLSKSKKGRKETQKKCNCVLTYWCCDL